MEIMKNIEAQQILNVYVDVLEFLRQALYCDYISDLRREPYNTQAKKLLQQVDMRRFPANQQRDTGDPDQLRIGGLRHTLQLLRLFQHILAAVVKVALLIDDLLLSEQFRSLLSHGGHHIGVCHLDGHILGLVKLVSRGPHR